MACVVGCEFPKWAWMRGDLVPEEVETVNERLSTEPAFCSEGRL